MKSLLSYVTCMVLGSLPQLHTIHMAILSVNHFNRTLFGLMRSLDQEQKPNWPIYLPSLVYAYNTTPHSTTGLQPYELMFTCKAPILCDNWLGLGHYELGGFKFKLPGWGSNWMH